MNAQQIYLCMHFIMWTALICIINIVQVEHDSLSRRDVTALLTITIKPEIFRNFRHDSWETNSVFIVDLNETIRRGFKNLTADYQQLRLEKDVGIDGQSKTWQIEVSETLISSGHGIKNWIFRRKCK